MDLNFNLHPAQLDIFTDPHRFKVIAAGRRFGKSFLSAVALIVQGLQEQNEFGYSLKGKDVWYIAPTFQQGKDIMWGLLKDLGKDVIAKTVENTATIELINGRYIKIKGSDRPDTLRGSGLGYVVLDEYADMRPNVWDEIIFPALTDVKGGAMFIGTPKGKNHFYDIYLQADKDDEWQAWHFNTTDNPLLDKELVEKARDRMSTQIFRQEFEASFSAVGGNIFLEEDVIYEEKEPIDGTWFISVDPAGFADVKEISKGNASRLDETAISVVKTSPSGWWVKEIDAGRWGVRETAIRILRHCKDVNPARVGIEKGVLMNALMPYLEEQMKIFGIFPVVEPVTHGNQRKIDRIVWSLQGRFQKGRISIKPGVWNKKFVEQLLDFPSPLAHDDLIDSLSYIDQISIVNFNTDIMVDEWEPIDLIAGY
jgi:hypothetical protein